MSTTSSFDNPVLNTTPAVRVYHISTAWGDWPVSFTALGLRELRLPGMPALRPRPRSAPASLLEDQEGKRGRAVVRALQQRLEGEPSELPWEAFDLDAQPPFYLRAW